MQIDNSFNRRILQENREEGKEWINIWLRRQNKCSWVLADQKEFNEPHCDFIVHTYDIFNDPDSTYHFEVKTNHWQEFSPAFELIGITETAYFVDLAKSGTRRVFPNSPEYSILQMKIDLDLATNQHLGLLTTPALDFVNHWTAVLYPAFKTKFMLNTRSLQAWVKGKQYLILLALNEEPNHTWVTVSYSIPGEELKQAIKTGALKGNFIVEEYV